LGSNTILLKGYRAAQLSKTFLYTVIVTGFFWLELTWYSLRHGPDNNEVAADAAKIRLETVSHGTRSRI